MTIYALSIIYELFYWYRVPDLGYDLMAGCCTGIGHLMQCMNIYAFKYLLTAWQWNARLSTVEIRCGGSGTIPYQLY